MTTFGGNNKHFNSTHTMMNKVISMLTLAALLPQCISAQQNATVQRDPESCTSIMVGKDASTDGSVITSHTCDSWYRNWLTMTPAADYKTDTIMNIYEGRMHTETSTDQTGMTVKGTIPQASHTFSYLDTAYPCANEKQLAMGETTISGRRDLRNRQGMFMIEELERVALQRCTTAREAIKLMGELIKQYGYGDTGECLTIADPKEVWHFEVFGEGKDKVGGVWAAVRIPDDHIGVSANIPRISTLDLKDTDNYMASDNVYDVAKKLGYWDGKSEFKFWKAYGGPRSGGNYKAFSIREYFIFNTFAPSLHLQYDAEELPFTIKPEKKISVQDVLAMFRQTYEGTEWDVTKNLNIEVKDRTTGETKTQKSPKANPWMRPDEIAMLNGIKDDAVTSVRNIAVPQCAYATVIQLRSWLPDAIGGLVWLSMDNPGQSPRVPIYVGATDVPASFKICSNHRYRDDSAAWHFRRTNKLAALKWGTCRKTLEKNRDHFEEKGLMETPLVESKYKEIAASKGEAAAREFLTDYSRDFAGAALLRWDEMFGQFWHENHFGF